MGFPDSSLEHLYNKFGVLALEISCGKRHRQKGENPTPTTAVNVGNNIKKINNKNWSSV